MESSQENSAGRLRVLALTSLFPGPRRPHFSLFNHQLLSAMARQCQLSLVAPLPFPLLRKARDQSYEPPEFAVSRPVFWYLPGALPAMAGKAFLRWAWPAVRRAARELRPQAVFTCWAHPDGWAGVETARRLGVPCLLNVVGSDLFLQAKDPARKPLIHQALAGAEAVVAVSQPLARRARTLGARAGRTFVVHNGVDTGRFRPTNQEQARIELGLPLDRRLLLFVGHLVPVKNPAAALKALTRVPGADLVMVGDGPERPGLERRIKELGISRRVHMRGAQNHAQVARYLAAADALILPSRHEGEPNVVLEALASGRPVAAFAVGGVPDIINPGQNGALAQPGDSDALGAAARQVLAAAWDPQKLAAHWGRSWDHAAAQYLDVMNAARLGALP